MRPLADFSLAVLAVAHELSTPDRSPTLSEIDARIDLPRAAKTIENTVKNLNRHGHLQVPRTRRVDYRNRPVNEYAPVDHGAMQGAGYVDLGQVISASWR